MNDWTHYGVTLLLGDVLERLADVADECVDCVITSPPYWMQRDYGVDGQIGLERHLEEHIDLMVEVFREVHRVLKPEGTCFVNYGDCYACKPNGRSAAATKAAGKDDRTFRDKPGSTIQGQMKPKDLCLTPERFAIAMQADGWWVRSKLVWAKPNPMPGRAKDKPDTAHEMIWLFTKSAHYQWDQDAVRIPTTKRNLRDYEPAGPEVWVISTASFKQAHFATFPPELVERCILAGCTEGGHVLDPFGGSGTTGLVAMAMGRTCTMVELNPEYSQIAERRIKQAWMGSVEKTNSAARIVPATPLPALFEWASNRGSST